MAVTRAQALLIVIGNEHVPFLCKKDEFLYLDLHLFLINTLNGHFCFLSLENDLYGKNSKGKGYKWYEHATNQILDFEGLNAIWESKV